MVSWNTIQTIAIFFGPLLLPRAIAYYRSLRNTPRTQIQPLPTQTSYALGILFASALIAFASTFPIFSSDNIFHLTKSRLQTSGGVLLTRLSALRTPTAQDEKLRTIFDEGGLDARLLYARFGPKVLTDIPFATPSDRDAGQTYLLYAIPTLLAPHLLHLLAIGVATSASLSGKQTSRWRTIATIAAVLPAVAEIWYMATYDSTFNARSTRLNEVDFVFWKLPLYRGLAIATVDALLGWAIWLQATGRAFVAPLSPADRVASASRTVEMVLGKARGLGIVRNGAMRNAELRGKVDAYWVKEREVMNDAFEQPEVLEAQRRVLGRMNVEQISREADEYLGGIFGNVQVVRPGAVPEPVMQQR